MTKCTEPHDCVHKTLFTRLPLQANINVLTSVELNGKLGKWAQVAVAQSRQNEQGEVTMWWTMQMMTVHTSSGHRNGNGKSIEEGDVGRNKHSTGLVKGELEEMVLGLG